MIERAAARSGGRGWNAARAGIGRLCGIFALTTVVLAGLPALAWAGEAELHELTWAHPSPTSVSRFIVLVSPVRGNAATARQVEVGKPAGAASGSLQFYSAIVPIDHEEFVAVAAVDNAGNIGAISTWSAVPPSRPGQPLVVEP